MNILIYGMPRTRTSMLLSRMDVEGVDTYYEPFHPERYAPAKGVVPAKPRVQPGENAGSFLKRLPDNGNHKAVKVLTGHPNNHEMVWVFKWADLILVTERPLSSIICSFALALDSNTWIKEEKNPEQCIAVHKEVADDTIKRYRNHLQNLNQLQLRGFEYHTVDYEDNAELAVDLPFKLKEATTTPVSHLSPEDRITNLEEVMTWVKEAGF